MCRKFKILAMFVILLFGVTIADAAEIHLKDGRFIVVERCWEKDSDVIFKLEGNAQLFSIPKEKVKEVTGQNDEQPGEQALN
jgi:hypothetical protein